MQEPTSATATFLFTDIEGSTHLLKSHRDAYATILADHHRLLREVFLAYSGKEVDNQGDAFFVAFTRAKDAVLAAAAAQRALASHPWPAGAPVRVRMGIHTGEADFAVDRYLGLSVHRAARISAVGHGGQVVVSQTTANLLEDHEDELPGIGLTDLGEHWLKDIARPARLYQLEIEGLRRTFPRLKATHPPGQRRRRRAALVGTTLLVGVAVTALALTSRDDAPPAVLPNSLVRIDPRTLKPTDVVPIGLKADLVVLAGGFVWVTNHVLRDIPSGALRNAGDRTLTRVDPSTGEAVVVGGGLAPCGLAADPSGDVWVANCFILGPGRSANVVRIDATTLEFKATWAVPAGDTFYRGLAYGGGSLWVSEALSQEALEGGEVRRQPTVTRLDPQTGAQRLIRLPRLPTALAWSERYADLWMSDFDVGSVSRLHPATNVVQTIDEVAGSPAHLIVSGDIVWVADWAAPEVVRLRAVGRARPRTVQLPAKRPADVGVWNVAVGAGAVWATTPRDRTLWRIDPKTNDVTRIPMSYAPAGVAAGDDDVWVTVRAG